MGRSGKYWALFLAILSAPSHATHSCENNTRHLQRPSDPSSQEDPGETRVRAFSPRLLTDEAFDSFARTAIQAAHYTQIQKIGRGQLGSVFRALDSENNLRVLKVSREIDPRFVAAFDGEARIMNHLAAVDPRFRPAVRRRFPVEPFVLEVLETDFIPGITLLEAFEQGRLISGSAQTLEVKRQIHELVGIAHAAGILHMDLSLKNILVDLSSEKPRAALLDWGISVHEISRGGHGPNFPDEPGFVADGTLGVISPDRHRKKPHSVRDDLHALRFLDWKLRLGNRGDRYLLVTRKLLGDEVPWEPGDPIEIPKVQEVGATPQDAEGFKWTFTEPAVALDKGGSLRDRLMGVAEFSTLPRTMDEREMFLKRAQTQAPSAFLRSYGKRLEAAYHNGTPLEDITSEILASSVLIENLSTTRGLRLLTPFLQDIVKKAAQIYRDTYGYNALPFNVGLIGPHHMLRYSQMKEKVDELHRQGVLPRDWAWYCRQVLPKKDRPKEL